MTKRVPHIPLRSVPARFGWSWITKASTPRNGRQSTRLPRRSAARARHCATGCGRLSVTRASGLVRQRTSAERIKALERENRELRQANEILRKASAYFALAELDRRHKP